MSILPALILVWYIGFIVSFALITLFSYNGMFYNKPKYFLLHTPKRLYEKTKMNYFGCVLIWFLEFLINPLSWIFAAIWWLFHVGRK